MSFYPPPQSFTTVHQGVNNVVRQLVPQASPWLTVTMSALGVASVALDIFSMRRARKVDSGVTERRMDALHDLYKGEIEKLRKERQGNTNEATNAQVSNVPVSSNPKLESAASSSAQSKYLTDEGVVEVDTGCIPCGKSHLGTMQGSFEVSADLAAKEGVCGPACQAKYNLAVREPAALFAGDWTPERVARTPEHHRAIIEKYGPRIRQIQEEALDGPNAEVRSALAKASALLEEANRFTGSGDPITHPEVDWRVADAQKILATAERSNTLGDDPLYKEVRSLRQDVYNRITTPKDLNNVARRANELFAKSQESVLAEKTPDDISRLAQRVADIRNEFREDLTRAETLNGGAVA